jgi:hypothetical protein
LDPDSYYPRSREAGFLIALAGGLALGIWASWSGSQSNLARYVRTADGGWWWIAGGAVLLVTLAFACCAP